MNTTNTTALETSIESLLEMDRQEARLREQMEQITRQKEEAKKTEGERLKPGLREKVSETRVALLGLLRMALNLEITFDDEYTVTLRRIVKDAGATGVSLSLVQEVLPDIEKLQAARDGMGKNGTDEIVELKAKEHLREGKGRGLFFVWNEKAGVTVNDSNDLTGSNDLNDQGDSGEVGEAAPKETPPEPDTATRTPSKSNLPKKP